MQKKNIRPSARVRSDDQNRTADGQGDEPGRFCKDVSGDRRRVIRHGEPRLASVVSTTDVPDKSARALSGGRQCASGAGRTDGGVVRQGGGGGDHRGLRFNLNVAQNGYAWWYIDAISRDGAYGLTIIAFIGSVFSPYYAWSKKRDPYNHCAINIALYGARNSRWAMTERGRNDINISETSFSVGGSALRWEESQLIIQIDEYTAPIPSRLRGVVRLTPEFMTDANFVIDNDGKHHWSPISPCASVEVDFENPSLSWSGHGYLDTNQGAEPLEKAFQYWDWSRTQVSANEAVILYNTDLWRGAGKNLALRLSTSGGCEAIDPPPVATLPATPVWRISRRTRSDENGGAKVIKTFEDTPFYSRSLIESRLFGATRRSMHESFSGSRFRSPFIKALLPFRMPRIAK